MLPHSSLESVVRRGRHATRCGVSIRRERGGCESRGGTGADVDGLEEIRGLGRRRRDLMKLKDDGFRSSDARFPSKVSEELRLTVLRVMSGVRVVSLWDLEAGVGRLREDESVVEDGPEKKRARSDHSSEGH